MRSVTIIFLFFSFFSNAQNTSKNQKLAGVNTYTLCNPDSSGLLQLMYNDVYNVYGLYKNYRRNYYYNSNNKHINGFSQYCTMSPTDTIWTSDAKWINSYDINNNLIDSVTMFGSGNSWIDSVNRTQHVYDLNHNLISSTRKGKNNNVWTNDIRTIFTYNSSNLILSVRYQNWDNINNVWSSFDTVKYVYNNVNQLTNRYYYRVTSNPTVWSYYAYDTVHYNALNSPIYIY